MKIRQVVTIILLSLLISGNASAGVADTKHNLSVSGPGSVKSQGESEICIFCHTPHNSDPSAPLWNRNDSGQTYTPYSSTTAYSSPGQPTGASILCLSCHDGTIALGEVLSRADPIEVSGSMATTMPTGRTRIGTDLSDDHPISFQFTSGLASQRGELVNPSSLTGAVKLDKTGQLQCTSCHDPHNNQYGKFLVMANTQSALCQTCHIKDFWDQTSHSTSTSQWNGVNPDPWPRTTETTVRDNACENCHTPHDAGSQERILNYGQRNNAAEEDNCLVCHNGHVAQQDIEAEFNKFFRHPITDTNGVHNPGESAVVTQRHVECVDCHNPHAANSANPLNGVRGINQSGNTINEINQVQELCYRCHADSPNKPAARTTRQFNVTNVRDEFSTTNTSYHPVAGTGKNSFVPSLISPLTTTSRITCIDCHNNNNGPGAGGNGPNGPHGSTYEPILERQYITTDPTTESPSVYAMCYKCHDRSSILSSESFPRHAYHITGNGGGMGGMGGMGLSTPCNVCHDPHGSQQPKLINFDTSVVSPVNGQIIHTSDSTSGSCTLSCHGRVHNPCTYNRVNGTASCMGMGGGGGGGGGM